MDLITLPQKKSRVPGVPKWEAVEQFFTQCPRLRDKAMLALIVYGGLRRSEVVRLNVGDYQQPFGLRRVLGKGGHETTVPLPEVARAIVSEYLAKERPGAAASEPLFRSSTGGTAVRRRPDACPVSASGRSSRTSASASAWTRFIPTRSVTRARSSCSSAPAEIFARCRSISARGSRRRIFSAW